VIVLVVVVEKALKWFLKVIERQRCRGVTSEKMHCMGLIPLYNSIPLPLGNMISLFRNCAISGLLFH